MKLDDIFKPVDKIEFFKKYWNKEPTVIKGDDQKFIDLPPSSDLPAMCAGKLDDSYWYQTQNLSAHASTVNKDGKLVQLNNVPISMYAQLYNSGYSFCFNDVSQADNQLKDLIEDASNLSEFRSNISVTCYIAPPNSNGILHYDHQHVFFLQREGVKYWRISEKPAIRNPFENFLYPNADQEYFDEMNKKGYEISIPANCGFQDIKLEAGDVLYMPPGFYHVQHTREKKSFHYTLTLDTVSFWTLFMSSLQLEFLKNCSSFNDDIRMMKNENRREFLSANLGKMKKALDSLTVEDLEKVFKI